MALNRILARQLIRFNCIEAINGRKNCEGGFKVLSSEPLRKNYPVAPACGGKVFMDCTKVCEGFARNAQKETQSMEDKYTALLAEKIKEIELIKRQIISKEELKKRYDAMAEDRNLFRKYGKKLRDKLEMDAIANNIPIRPIKGVEKT